MAGSNLVATNGSRRRVLQVLIAGTNVWFVGVAYPWFFVEQPTLVQSAVHALPLLILLTGCALLAIARARLRVGTYTRNSLAIGIPLSVGIAAATRGETVNMTAMPGWVMLLCVVSLWVFVGVLSLADTEPAHANERPVLPTTTPTTAERPRATQLLAIAAALATVTLAPRWLDPTEQQSAWGGTHSAGSMLTAAVALAIALGILLLVLGPVALSKHAPVLPPLRQRLWPNLVLAGVSVIAYVLTR